MTELDDLWAQLRAGDDAFYPLADALIEAGDPQGELMSVQLDIAVSHGHELLALRAREKVLLAQLRDHLLGGLPAGEYQIRRGVVASARFGAGFFVNREQLAARTVLDELWLRVNFEPEEVPLHPATRSVRTLVFGIPKGLSAIPLRMPVLEELRILAAGDATCDFVAANPHVRRVVLDRIRLDGYASLAKILPQVTTLKLRTWISPGVMNEFVDAPLEQLEVLRVPGHEVGRFIPRLLARDLPRLRELDLRGVDLAGATRIEDPMTDAHVAALASSPLRPTKLALGISRITSITPLLAAPIVHNLEELIVERVPLTRDDVEVLCALPKLGKLTLVRCNIDDACIPALAQPRWKLLDLRDNPLVTERSLLVHVLGGDVVLDETDDWIEVA